jgi:hypothetical protein
MVRPSFLTHPDSSRQDRRERAASEHEWGCWREFMRTGCQSSGEAQSILDSRVLRTILRSIERAGLGVFRNDSFNKQVQRRLCARWQSCFDKEGEDDEPSPKVLAWLTDYKCGEREIQASIRTDGLTVVKVVK